MKSSELREGFLSYFEKNGHKRLPSSSLVPLNDPTLFFTNAGMVQFKDVFLGHEKRDYRRATTSQKCMRVSGKHNDLENVGHTPRHHTFFEMLGNFSFGDYFKKEAIAFGWEFLTGTLSIPKELLYVTIFDDDDEAFKLWQKHVDKSRIFRFGEKDNFWSMGETGPCGPCSEIHFDRTPTGSVVKGDLETDRFMEVWNLVFMQFDRDASGKKNKLAKPSIDTGMGLERLAAVVEGTKGNYETDLFQPIVRMIEKTCNKKYTADYSNTVHDDISMRVIADHIRAMVFLIADGVQPSNEGRGYVLRRIIRRAARHGKLLKIEKPFFVPIANVVIDEMGCYFTELIQHRNFIEKVIANEEYRFNDTLDKGLELLDSVFADLRKKGEKILPGGDIFKLYDTYGFPKDLTQDIAGEAGFLLDNDGFESAMNKQREQARSSWKGSGQEAVAEGYKQISQKGIRSKFVGYDTLNVRSKILTILKDGRETAAAVTGEKIAFVTETTPFYGESGGQVGDSGVAVAEGLEVDIENTIRPLPDVFVHLGVVKRGELKVGNSVTLAVDEDRRGDIKRNHTATHILHKALRSVLGEHVKQSGSLVTPLHLRFDFSHFSQVKPEELKEVESFSNTIVRSDLSVVTHVVPYQEALQKGALAFFGDKYTETVRMVCAGDHSMELCGGTHVARTGEIGMIKIVSESSVAAGVRRIEAVTGKGAENYVLGLEKTISTVALRLKAGGDDLDLRAEKLIEENKQLKKELEKVRAKLVSGSGAEVESEVIEVGDIKVLAKLIEEASPKELRSHLDALKTKIGSGVVLLLTEAESKTSFLIGVTNDLTGRVSAGDLVKEVAVNVGGTGGGRRDMAQGGSGGLGLFEKIKGSLINILGKV